MFSRSLLLSAALTLLGATPPALADGPGLGNLTYGPGELFQPVSVIQSPLGQGNAAMVNGYLMLSYSTDGGGTATDGGIEFWDVSDPRNPVLAKNYDDADTHGIREPSTFGLSDSYASDVMVTQAIDGIQFWDVTDPLAIQLIDYMALPGIGPSAYEGAWWLFFQAPYVYVAGTGNGLYVVDASDPANPVLAKQVATSAIAGLSPGLAWAVGNLLVLMNNDGAGFATMDISDPVDPVLLHSVPGLPGYTHLFAAGRILTSGGAGGANVMGVHSVGHDGIMALIGTAGSGLGNGGYGSYQDGFFHSGFSAQYAKFDVAGLTQVATGTSGIPDRDEDSGQVFGNVVFVGNDHGQGSALIVHQTAPDTNGPDVHWVHPADAATGLAPTSRVGLSMSDIIDIASVDSATFAVRPQGGAPLPGKYSTQMGLVNFAPDAPLEADTVYEVVVSGIRDVAGNAGGSFTSSFTTGADGPPHCSLDALAPEEVGASASFDAASVSGNPSSYSWDFGDGSPPTPPSGTSSASYAYSGPGRYGVVLTVENVFGISSCSSVQIVHYPLTVSPPTASSSIIHDGTYSFSVNPDNDTVTAIDDATLAKAWEAPVGGNPRTLAAAPNGELWVVNQASASISVLSTGGSLVDTIALPFASQPYGIAFAPDQSAAYVTLTATGELLELDLAGNVTDSVAVGPKPRGIAISGDSSRILVTRFVSPASHAELQEVDVATFGSVATHTLQFDPGPDTEASGRGVPNYLSSVRISPDGRRAFVPSKKDNVARGLFNDSLPLTFESRTRTIVSQLDLLTNTEDLGARLDLNDHDMAQSVVFSPLGDLFFVAAQGSNRVEVHDSNTRASLGGMNTGRAPQGLAFNSDASKLYVQNFMSRTVSVFDTSGFISAAGNSAPLLAEVSSVASEALGPDVLLGKQIFYDASDTRMSLDGYISCASCHLDGGSDGQIWDFTQAGEGLRNTIDLIGRAGLGHGNVHWTANFDEIQDFENDIRLGFAGTGFMDDADFSATSDPLGSPKAGLSSELDALAAYVSSLDSFPDSPHRNPGGTLTADGLAGRAVFNARGCAACHAGDGFSDGLRHDVGTIQASSGLGIGLPLAGVGFETPTLKGLWSTPPYLHNGQAATLADVLNSPDHGGTDTLTPTERSQLVSYLLQIDDNEPSECDDGFDNDGDGLVDAPADPGCDDAADTSERSPALPCDDGEDNDGDGRIDFDPVTAADPAFLAGFGDPGCWSPTWNLEDPQCQDGVNNDGDGLVDFDRGVSATGSSQSANPDPQCLGKPWKNKESSASCGLGAELILLLPFLLRLRSRRLDAAQGP